MSGPLPEQMRAVLTVSHGGLDQLVLKTDYPVPTPGPEDVLLRVAATAVNFHDLFTRRGMPGIKLPLPVVVGSDFAGEVVARGSAVETPGIGDRVLVDPVDFSTGKPCMYGEVLDGGRAEYVAVKAALCIPVPDTVSLEQAAALPLAYGTAYRMLFTQGGVAAGDRVLVLGASGGVGAACVQLAGAVGAEVIACASTDEKLARLGDAGATHLVNYREEPFLDAVRRIYGKPRVAGGGGVSVAVNFTGGDTLPDTQRCVEKGGRILCCGATAGFDLALDARYWWTYEHRMIGSNGWTRQDLLDLLAMIAEGQLDPLIDSTLPLEQAADAEARLEDRRVVGKLLLRP
ncbi:zinc-binding dehydrogenase [Pseudohaliea sp.]|uniref:quinone oxidoreductase family protein n=1 Tax=Pseudohaliea sp. TaxID=2740289 RepID=UPI0032F04C10